MDLTKSQADKARSWMRKHKSQYKDSVTEEIDCTKLAEDCCAELELYDEDENIPEDLFNIASQVVS